MSVDFEGLSFLYAAPEQAVVTEEGAAFNLFYASSEELGSFTVTYYSDGTSGSVPIDDKEYAPGDTAIILDGSGLGKVETVPNVEYGGTLDAYYDFLAWNTDPNGDGDGYLPGDAITVNDDIALYAIWTGQASEGPAPSLMMGARAAAGLVGAADTIGPVAGELILEKTHKINNTKTVFDEENPESNYWVWDVTVALSGLDKRVTTDVVLLLDRSGSMAGTKLTSVKNAANKFVNILLPANNEGNTRIALVPYNNVANTGIVQFTTNASSLTQGINNITATGGTNIQAAIMQAQTLLTGSQADNKYIVLLSDGNPTYSYRVTGVVDNGAVQHVSGSGSATQWTIDYSKVLLDFSSSTTGNGSSYTTGITKYNYGGTAQAPREFPPDHGVPTIAQANVAKGMVNGIFTIAAQGIDDDGKFVLQNCSSAGYYDATAASSGGLDKVFEDIAGQIRFAANDATVMDPMAKFISLEGVVYDSITGIVTSGLTFEKIAKDGTKTDVTAQFAGKVKVTIDSVTGREVIEWDVGDVKESDGKITMTYSVTIKDRPDPGSSGQIPDKDYALDSKMYPTNDDTFVYYIDVNGEDADKQFDPVPQVGFPMVGNIQIYLYLLDEFGKPYNQQSGTPVASRDQILRYDLRYYLLNI